MDALRRKLDRAGIDINLDLSNLVSLDRDFHASRTFGESYYREVLDIFEGASSSSAFRSRMDDLAQTLLQESGKVK